jgi:hypothetical protein
MDFSMAHSAPFVRQSYMRKNPPAFLFLVALVAITPSAAPANPCQPASDSLSQEVSQECLDYSARAREKLYIMMRDFDLSGFKLGDLYRIKGIEDRIGELEIDWRDLPDLSYSLGVMDLEERLQEKTGRNEFYVKDFEALGLLHVVEFIPLSSSHLEALKLTAQQLEEMGAKAKYSDEDIRNMR